jgi:hypothetical protein
MAKTRKQGSREAGKQGSREAGKQEMLWSTACTRREMCWGDVGRGLVSWGGVRCACAHIYL